jgi:hypothetical protein
MGWLEVGGGCHILYVVDRFFHACEFGEDHFCFIEC